MRITLLNYLTIIRNIANILANSSLAVSLLIKELIFAESFIFVLARGHEFCFLSPIEVGFQVPSGLVLLVFSVAIQIEPFVVRHFVVIVLFRCFTPSSS